MAAAPPPQWPARDGGAGTPGDGGPDTRARVPSPALLLTLVLVTATAGLVYELSMAAVASYLLGDSVRQFSLVIGAYLSALGVGAHVSRYVDGRLAATFVDVELAAAVLGGLSAPGLMLAFAFTRAFELVLFAEVVVVGALVGLELPLLFRILERKVEFKDLVARALSFDYAGALVGSVAFSIVLVPKLGLARTSVLSGLLNAAVALVAASALSHGDAEEARALAKARVRAVVVGVVLAVAFFGAGRATEISEGAIYPGTVVLARQSSYQRIVLTDHAGALELFLNGNLQFSSRDEYRYHEALVHPAMAAAKTRRHVVIGGGGDGLAAREILRWPDVETVTLVDLDAEVTDLARSFSPLVRLNGHSLDDPRVTVVNEDAMRWFAETSSTADVVVLDFPDPSTFSVGKLYSTTFYARVKRHLAPGGAVVVQSSSPFLANATFSCITSTLEAAGFVTRPYQAFVPAFGSWGFVLAKSEPFDVPAALPPATLRFLDAQVLADMFGMPADTRPKGSDVNRLDNQILVAHYLDEWERWGSR
jgi:spermidine synthase